MFTVKSAYGDVCFISNGSSSYLHSDGSVYDVIEYFPTEEIAQKVLDKFYPKLKHIWKHGDVFESGHPMNQGIMMYVIIHGRSPTAIYLERNCLAFNDLEYYLKNAKFLFNIKDVISDVIQRREVDA